MMEKFRLERSSEDHLVLLPTEVGHWTRLSRALSRQVLKVSSNILFGQSFPVFYYSHSKKKDNGISQFGFVAFYLSLLPSKDNTSIYSVTTF